MSRGTRYRVVRKLAHGGMAEIFLAMQVGAEGFEKPVVLKRILPGLAADPGFVRMLVDEAHIASSLNHSHLVQVLDLGKADDQFFLVLEFVDGWSLEQVRRRARKARIKMPLPLQLYVVSALCRGLDYVHRRTRNGKPLGIVHRDVTPQNVLLSREGEVKLADFGIAKAIGRREKSATGVIKGKFAYMSPEQTIGAELDARSDLFSVGTLLYLLSTGKKPFDAATDLDVLMQVRRARFEKPSSFVRDFNPDVERFIVRALRADRSKRWQSAEQMADRLDSILVKLGQPSGAAALKRWLDNLSARDGVLPPGDVRDAPLDAATGTMALVSKDLELQNLTPPEEPAEDDEEDEISTARESLRARTRATNVGTRKQKAPVHEAVTAVAGPSYANQGVTAMARVESVPGGVARLDRELDELLSEAAVERTNDALFAEPDEADTAHDAEEPSELFTATTSFERVDDIASEVYEEDTPSEAGESVPPGPLVDSTPPLLLTKPAQPRPSPRASWGRSLGKAAVGTMLLAVLLGGGAYFARPYLPPGVVPAEWERVFEEWIERGQRSLELVRHRLG